MICIVGSRRSGKTAALISLSESTGVPIAVSDARSARQVARQACSMGKAIPEPFVLRDGGRGAPGMPMRPVLVDEAQRFFERRGYEALAVTVDEGFVSWRAEMGERPTLLGCLRVWLASRKERP